MEGEPPPYVSSLEGANLYPLDVKSTKCLQVTIISDSISHLLIILPHLSLASDT